MSELFEKARAVRERLMPHILTSRLVRLRTVSGKEFARCNVENSAYPQGLCAEAGAIAARLPVAKRKFLKFVS